VTAAGDSGLTGPRRALAVLALSLGTGMLVIDNTIATIALPTIAAALDIAPSRTVVVVTAYQVVMLMALLPLSALGDRIGHRRLYQGGQLVFLLASVGSALATSLPTLLAARCLQALGVAAAMSVGSALLRATYPQSMLGRGIALNGLIVAVAAAAAPAIGGLILGVASWRWVFAAAAPFALLSLLLGHVFLPRPSAHSSRFDMAGAALCAAMFGLLMTGLSLVLRGDSMLGWGLVVAGIPVAVTVVRRELRSPRPILPVDLLRRATFALPVATLLFAFCSSLSFLIATPFRLSAAGVSTGVIGLVLAVWPLSMMAAAPVAGVLADRGPRGLAGALGMLMAAVGLIAAGLVPANGELWLLALPMALTGAGMGVFMSPTAHLIVGAAPRDRAASAGALVSSTRFVGQALGAALASAFLATAFGTGPVPAFMSAGLALAAAGFSLVTLMRGGEPGSVRTTEVVDVEP
jgi:MFS transporter, DHA2 family, multidrug resistance protein